MLYTSFAIKMNEAKTHENNEWNKSSQLKAII